MSACTSKSDASLSAMDEALIQATQAGLPLSERPFEAVARALGITEDEVCARFERMRREGVVRRIALVPNHYKLGYVANGMSVWDIDDAALPEIAPKIAALPGVSHCYKRPRHLPDWPYNLFAMLHGRDREAVLAQKQEIEALVGPACRASDILFSTRILKKTGFRLSTKGGA
ncbi:MAG: Lrp/AsnC family transcriptional regulator [Gammaproteobacteria bacterium]|nr:MAG: Lrp/AsnC family transcriptional regulator [Gammaproteobacteria bacterium]